MRQKGQRCLKLLSVSGAFAVGAAGALALATSLLLRSALPTRGTLASLLSVWLLVFGQIVLISEILSELHALGSAGMLVGHVLLLGAALIVFVRAGRKRLAPWPDGAGEALRALLRESPGISLFAGAVGLLAAANLVDLGHMMSDILDNLSHDTIFGHEEASPAQKLRSTPTWLSSP